jgi:long-subunit acyl-CoA synthetase (AMP-forming)
VVGQPGGAVAAGDGAAATGRPNVDDLLGDNAPDFGPATHRAVPPYSSGTSGNPTGVLLTHRILVADMAQVRPLLAMTPDDRILAVLPFFHTCELTVLLNSALQVRAAVVVMARFDLTVFLDTIQEHGITYGFEFVARRVAA